MFTGIVEEIGKVVTLEKGKISTKLSVKADFIFQDLKIGDSVAVNGACLTVSSYKSKIFTADVMNETLSRSSLGLLRTGMNVNLERAMPANGRFGGHIVSGHIDDTGILQSFKQDDNAVWITVTANQNIIKYIVEKGSITMEGISLTIAKVNSNNFLVSVMPHTYNNTTLFEKRIGDAVNLEVDVLGKYVHKFLNLDNQNEQSSGKITIDFLKRNGFNI
ncbi:riboflavin synthase [Clostridium oryzae]|uniref:Riboflavin synthase n=1 Tax=Clostridium oryzae TaxID=1450648 RepID=A0A1V4IR92_9CLOT|nr:riboflavin synthase [Clostridium oryzae]OPJ62456.1 riboflavin synthase [Clostridium oryzae]